MTTVLAQDNLKLLESGDFADFEVICQGRVWKVHSAIMGGRSTWVKRALSQGWKEAQTRKIIIENADPEVMDILVKYIHTNDLPPVKLTRRPNPCLEHHVQLYIRADYFLLPRLKEQALERLKAGFCSDAIRYFRYPVLYHSKALYEALVGTWSESEAQNVLKDLCKAVKLSYSVLTARDLHKTVTAFTLCLRGRIDIAVLESLFIEVPQFRADFHKVITALHFDEGFGTEVGLRTLLDKAQGGVQKHICRICLSKLGMVDNLVVSPLPNAEDKWCNNCGHKGFMDLIEKLIKFMPLD